MARAPTPVEAEVVILVNRRLGYAYHVVERWEAGMVLTGSEVKSLRAKDVQWGDAHARVEEGELWLHGLHIGEYRQAGPLGHEPGRVRKLLLHRREIDRIQGELQGQGRTVVPDRLLFRRGHAKLVICLVRGKDRGDKRQDLIQRSGQREIDREISRRSRGR